MVYVPVQLYLAATRFMQYEGRIKDDKPGSSVRNAAAWDSNTLTPTSLYPFCQVQVNRIPFAPRLDRVHAFSTHNSITAVYFGETGQALSTVSFYH